MSESPVTAPVCYRHPSKETYVRCTRCERPICPDCMNEASVGHQCPECVAQGKRTQRPARTAFGGSVAGRAGTVTKTLIGIKSEDPDMLHDAPHTTLISRPDEIKAAKEPILRWKP